MNLYRHRSRKLSAVASALGQGSRPEICANNAGCGSPNQLTERRYEHGDALPSAESVAMFAISPTNSMVEPSSAGRTSMRSMSTRRIPTNRYASPDRRAPRERSRPSSSVQGPVRWRRAARGCHPHAVSRHGAEEEGCCRSTMLRILIADDHAMIRQGLRKLIEEQKDWEVCAEASTGWPGRGTHC